MSNMFNNIVRALRLPFLTASILPFIFGSLIVKENFNLLGFILGLIAAGFTHLSANLINDYADSKSGADWIDKSFYKFFGGSKLIQENALPEKFYLKAAIICAIIAAISVVILAAVLKSILVIILYLIIIFLSWSYSEKPLQFSYHRLGEAFLFFLFGPALVEGGYFIQTGIFPDLKSFILSLPFGFLTTAILFANEVPDFPEDKQAGKLTWVSLTGAKNAFVLYYLLILGAAFSIILGIICNYLSSLLVFSFLLMLPAIKAGMILKNYPQDKSKLIESSKITIAIQALVSLALIVSQII